MKNIRNVEQEWQAFSAKCLPPNMPWERLWQLKIAFCAGILYATERLVPEPDANPDAIALAKECDAVAQKIVKDRLNEMSKN